MSKTFDTLVCIAAFACWVRAIIVDANSDALGWVVVDVILFPFGVIRGLLMFIGVI